MLSKGSFVCSLTFNETILNMDSSSSRMHQVYLLVSITSPYHNNSRNFDKPDLSGFTEVAYGEQK